MSKSRNGSSTMVRVNFMIERPLHEEFQCLVERGNSDMSKVLRGLIREFIRKTKKETFGNSVVQEVADGVYPEPVLPKEE